MVSQKKNREKKHHATSKTVLFFVSPPHATNPTGTMVPQNPLIFIIVFPKDRRVILWIPFSDRRPSNGVHPFKRKPLYDGYIYNVYIYIYTYMIMIDMNNCISISAVETNWIYQQLCNPCPLISICI